MGKLGISIYQEKSTEREILDYIDRAAKQGFSRILVDNQTLKIEDFLISITDDQDSKSELFIIIDRIVTKGDEIGRAHV